MKKKQDTKEIILQCATRLFQRQGYNGTGLNQIIEESGAPKGSIYYHFPNGKEEIAVESIAMMRKMLMEGAEKDLAEKIRRSKHSGIISIILPPFLIIRGVVRRGCPSD